MHKKHLFKSISFILALLFLSFMFSCKKDNIDYSEIKAILDTVYKNDQIHRQKIDNIIKTYGANSKEMDSLWKVIRHVDSVNLIIVENILEQYGWFGGKDINGKIIGGKPSATFFLVIQHSDLETQQKYLPMMKDAVTKGYISGIDLAYLEDRIAVGQKKRQIYGTQVGIDTATNQPFVLPLVDPDNVDERRKKVGLSTMSEYVSHAGITWNVEEYKKQLPEIEQKYYNSVE
ncbi:MAG: hypothetical protein JXR68_07215 [Bacteroidales bacterium]|nr:hypothetical protein [Bacteroidales bacterium]